MVRWLWVNRPLRVLAALTVLMTLSMASALQPSPVDVAADGPTLTLTPNHVSCTTEMTARGEGFIPGSEVVVSPGGVDDIPTSIFLSYLGPTTVADDGSFALTIPGGFGIYDCFGGPLGRDGAPYEFTASTVDRDADEQQGDAPFAPPVATASFTFAVNPADPRVTLVPDRGTACDTPRLHGENFTPGTYVFVMAGDLGGHVFAQVTSNDYPLVREDGTFDAELSHFPAVTGCHDGYQGREGHQLIVGAQTGRPKIDENPDGPSAADVYTVELPASELFRNTWSRTDKPVADTVVDRTWMWGAEAISDVFEEPYAESPGGMRQVQYFDKSRMELTCRVTSCPDRDPSSVWYVTNGLLVVEMVEGKYQIGDNLFDVSPEPPTLPVAGDLEGTPIDSIPSITYADIDRFDLRSQPARDVGELIWEYVNDIGLPRPGDPYHGFDVTAAYHVPDTDHTIASVFWDFMNSTGMVWEDGDYVEDSLFVNPFYATGFPITEAYWLTTLVDRVPKEVLWQCFERRCLTYTPSNPEGWKVEAGNVGMHYTNWRYGGGSEPEFDLVFDSLNDDVVVTGTLEFNGSVMTVTIMGEGVAPGTEHPVAMHGLRGDGPFYLDPQATCPTADHDLDGDGIIEEGEAQQAYGAALLPMPPYPVAADDGTVVYHGSFDAEVVGWDPIAVPALRVIVVSGMTVEGVYDPTIPIACGRIIYVEPT